MKMVSSLNQKILASLRRQQLMQAGDRVCVAVSGGADSVALLRLLLELRADLGIVLSAAHVNHALRGEESDEDERFVEGLARASKLEFHSERAEVKSHSEEKHLSLEAAGRELRYDYFRHLLERGVADRIATAHTLDDQAETVLLRLVRGAGTRGLAGIYPKVNIPVRTSSGNVPSPASIVRPLLSTSRKELEAYLSEVGQSWREDSSNQDKRHARNRVRHAVLPWLEENLNPSVRSTLAEAAEVARAEEEYWQQQIVALTPTVVCNKKDVSNADAEQVAGEFRAIDVRRLQSLPLALQRRIIRSFGSSFDVHLEFDHVEQILQWVNAESSQGPLALPGGSVRKSVGKLFFEPQCAPADSVSNFEYFLTVPGGIAVKETQSEFHATVVSAVSLAAYNSQDSEDLIDARMLAQKLQVRNWREGDRFWPAHTKAPRKIKQLLQERHVTGRERKCWPVIVSGDEIVWMRGFSLPSHLGSIQRTGGAVRIQEIPLTGKH
jgi:tRNA(Ile)-lysidine synthase